MGDLALDWGGDLQLDETGDYLTVSGNDELQQRIVRRFLTTSLQRDAFGNVITRGEYRFDQTYGGNARYYVDRSINDQAVRAIEKRLRDSIAQEGAIDLTNSKISVTQIPQGILVNAAIALKTGGFVLVPQLRILK